MNGMELGPWEFEWEEGDVISIAGNISVDHDMDGGAVTPDIILF